MQSIGKERLLEIFDEYEPDEEWFENEHELWLDLRLAVINAPTVDSGQLYGDYVSLEPGGSEEKAKTLLVEEIKSTVDELAKRDEFWIVKENPDYPGCRTIGWKISVPHL